MRTGTEKRWDTEHHILDAGGAGGRMQEEEWDPAVSPGNGGAHASPMEGRKGGALGPQGLSWGWASHV